MLTCTALIWCRCLPFRFLSFRFFFFYVFILGFLQVSGLFFFLLRFLAPGSLSSVRVPITIVCLLFASHLQLLESLTHN